MGFLDKAKATATAAAKQGQAKVEAIQQSRAEAELYRSLGEATYQARRHDGDPAAVERALTALDTHFAQVAAAAAAANEAAAPPAGGPPPASNGAPSAQSAPSAPSAPSEGNFTLNDM